MDPEAKQHSWQVGIVAALIGVVGAIFAPLVTRHIMESQAPISSGSVIGAPAIAPQSSAAPASDRGAKTEQPENLVTQSVGSEQTFRHQRQRHASNFEGKHNAPDFEQIINTKGVIRFSQTIYTADTADFITNNYKYIEDGLILDLNNCKMEYRRQIFKNGIIDSDKIVSINISSVISVIVQSGVEQAENEFKKHGVVAKVSQNPITYWVSFEFGSKGPHSFEFINRGLAYKAKSAADKLVARCRN